MKIICPSCGTHLTLDLLAGSDAARETLANVLKSLGPLSRALMQYLTLFRPKTRSLTADRVLVILERVLTDIQAGQIRYDKKVYPAPEAAWLYAIDQAMQKRAKGGFKHLPLDGHNWLYQVISGWTPDDSALVDESAALPPPASASTASPVKSSQTVKAAQALQEFIEHG